MIDSRCGLHCTDCGWKQSHGCGGCIETMGHPFHGECPIATCCQNKGYSHCGECNIIPCEKLYEYSYLDPEHGDKPQGARIEVCRQWAVEAGMQAWGNVMLTSAGFEDFESKPKSNIVNRFLQMLGKPIAEAKVLFIPAAAIDEEAVKMADWCKKELLRLGVKDDNIFVYNLDDSITETEAMQYDVIYFTSGSTSHLLKRVRETSFDVIVKKMVHSNKVYVGVSAGSIIATPNIGDPFHQDTAGLCLVNAYLSVHCPADAEARTDLPLPHIALTDNQALVVRWDGYEMIKN